MGLNTFCQEQNRGSEYAQVFCGGLGGDESGDWQMASITRHVSLKWWNKAYPQNLRIMFLFLNSWLSWKHLHSLLCLWVFGWLPPSPLSSLELQLGPNLCTEEPLSPGMEPGAQSLKQNKTTYLQRRLNYGGLCLKSYLFFSALEILLLFIQLWWESY